MISVSYGTHLVAPGVMFVVSVTSWVFVLDFDMSFSYQNQILILNSEHEMTPPCDTYKFR